MEEERKQMEEHRKKKELGYEIEYRWFQQGLDRICSYVRNRTCRTRRYFRWQWWVVNIWFLTETPRRANEQTC